MHTPSVGQSAPAKAAGAQSSGTDKQTAEDKQPAEAVGATEDFSKGAAEEPANEHAKKPDSSCQALQDRVKRQTQRRRQEKK